MVDEYPSWILICMSCHPTESLLRSLRSLRANHSLRVSAPPEMFTKATLFHPEKMNDPMISTTQDNVREHVFEPA
jgi:hypothetical protein